MEAVVDASAALKWQFADEEATDAATALLQDFVQGRITLITPTLFPFESSALLTWPSIEREFERKPGTEQLTILPRLESRSGVWRTEIAFSPLTHKPLYPYIYLHRKGSSYQFSFRVWSLVCEW